MNIRKQLNGNTTVEDLVSNANQQDISLGIDSKGTRGSKETRVYGETEIEETDYGSGDEPLVGEEYENAVTLASERSGIDRID